MVLIIIFFDCEQRLIIFGGVVSADMLKIGYHLIVRNVKSPLIAKQEALFHLRTLLA